MAARHEGRLRREARRAAGEEAAGGRPEGYPAAARHAAKLYVRERSILPVRAAVAVYATLVHLHVEPHAPRPLCRRYRSASVKTADTPPSTSSCCDRTTSGLWRRALCAASKNMEARSQMTKHGDAHIHGLVAGRCLEHSR